MVQNIDTILSRGERLDVLVDRTDSMAHQAHAFRRGARGQSSRPPDNHFSRPLSDVRPLPILGVRRQMWWKNTRLIALSVIVCTASILATDWTYAVS